MIMFVTTALMAVTPGRLSRAQQEEVVARTFHDSN